MHKVGERRRGNKRGKKKKTVQCFGKLGEHAFPKRAAGGGGKDLKKGAARVTHLEPYKSGTGTGRTMGEKNLLTRRNFGHVPPDGAYYFSRRAKGQEKGWGKGGNAQEKRMPAIIILNISLGQGEERRERPDIRRNRRGAGCNLLKQKLRKRERLKGRGETGKRLEEPNKGRRC